MATGIGVSGISRRDPATTYCQTRMCSPIGVFARTIISRDRNLVRGRQ